MIKTFYQEDIINCLAALITYGINNNYSYKTIEERLVSSSFVNDLENNKYDINTKINKVVESTYVVSLSDKQVDISFKGLFFAESYFKLFLYFNRSFEYIFLYWPLSFFVERYSVFHEMDFSSLRKDFENKTKETTLFKKLAKERKIRLKNISKLTGISINTINKYCKNDKYLYVASHANIYKFSLLFEVKENIFVSNLAIYLDRQIYLFDERNKDYRNYLGLYFANYADDRINEKELVLDQGKNCFVFNNDIKLVVLADGLDNLSISKLNIIADPKTYIVIFLLGFIGDYSSFKHLQNLNALEVYVLTQEYVYMMKEQNKKEITDTIYRMLIIKAMEKIQ